MKGTKICIVLCSVFLVLCMSCIFYNSTQSSEVSNHRSRKIAEQVKSIAATETPPTVGKAKMNWNEWTRKAAHSIEFALLGVCIGGLLVSIYLYTGRWFLGSALLVALFTGVMDEYIQSFFGRTSTVKDVLLDFISATATILAIGAVFKIVTYTKKRRKNHGEISK